ncbi:MAG: pantothenate kinase [Polaribacter sp.]|nr:MAG: pantothenate kinase [Polaribacter sp.]
MYLIVDVGNTRVKTAVFKDEKIVKNYVSDKSDIVFNVKNVVSEYGIKDGIISSVRKLSVNDVAELQKNINLIELNYQTKVPFTNRYKTPKTLGVDRIALVSAGVKQFPNKNVLIIDAGTCITYDFVSKKGEYLGGAISLGLKMRYQALHDYTAKLPKLEIKEINNFIGNDTETSIHSGVINGVVKEIEGVVGQYQQKYEDLTIVLTGGDMFFLQKQLNFTIFANSNFLLEEINKYFISNSNECYCSTKQSIAVFGFWYRNKLYT